MSDADAVPYVVVAAAATVVSVLVAAAINPDWSWTQGALSDLGAAGATHAWVFNAGMVATGLLGAFGASRLDGVGAGRFDAGAGRWLAGTGFLLLVGVGLFPEGTAPHAPLAVGFFAVEAAGIAVLGGERGDALAVGVVAASVLAGAWALHAFPGVAPAETAGILGFVVAYARLLPVRSGVRSVAAR